MSLFAIAPPTSFIYTFPYTTLFRSCEAARWGFLLEPTVLVCGASRKIALARADQIRCARLIGWAGDRRGATGVLQSRQAARGDAPRVIRSRCLMRLFLSRAFGPRSSRWSGWRPKIGRTTSAEPFDAVMMFKVLVLPTLYNLADEQVEHLIRDRLSFMRFLALTWKIRSQIRPRCGCSRRYWPKLVWS